MLPGAMKRLRGRKVLQSGHSPQAQLTQKISWRRHRKWLQRQRNYGAVVTPSQASRAATSPRDRRSKCGSDDAGRRAAGGVALFRRGARNLAALNPDADRPVHAVTSPSGVHLLSEHDRCQGAGAKTLSMSSRQLCHAQTPEVLGFSVSRDRGDD
jgi:hypothetical protein